jgi:hypothetical protein
MCPKKIIYNLMIKEFFNNLFQKKRKIEINSLPSQGLFYSNDIKISIKSASKSDIKDYEDNYIKDDIGVVIYYIKKIVERNIIVSEPYKYDDIKSIDVIFIFLEIVKLTKGRAINLIYFDKDKDRDEKIEFGSRYFNYFQLGDLIKYYDYKNRCFVVDGYRYTLPSIGVENSLTNFLMIKSAEEDSEVYNTYLYDFTHFVGHNNHLKYSEIENLLQIFNFDMEPSEIKKVKNIINMFSPIQKYSLIKDGVVVEMTAKINLEKIWK